MVAGADIRADRARMMGERYGFTSYTDCREMLEREQLNLVAVVSTVASHREAVEAAADRGLHVRNESSAVSGEVRRRALAAVLGVYRSA